MRTRLRLIVLLTVAAAAATVFTSGRRFYDDDPIARVPESGSAADAKPLNIELFFEYGYNLFVNAKRTPSNTRAGNVNTIDEVPDSSWFTNRIGAAPMTDAQLAHGVNSDTAPSPERWTLLREKSAGTNPGVTARDANGQTWFLQFDAPDFPGASTAAVEINSKLFWPLGYNQVETFITTFDPARLEIDPAATAKRPNGEIPRVTQ